MLVCMYGKLLSSARLWAQSRSSCSRKWQLVAPEHMGPRSLTLELQCVGFEDVSQSLLVHAA